jgi:hypothetical protein
MSTFARTGELLAYGNDLRGRPDAVTFTARSGEPTIDWLAEAYVWIDRWATRAGVAVLFESDGGSGWEECAAAMPFDALQIVRETEIRLVFSQWVRLQPGRMFRLFLAGAVVTRPDVRIVALQRAASFDSGRRPHALRRRAS